MEQLYSVGTSNRYAAFMNDEEDPGDVINPPEKEVSTTKTSKGVKETSKQAKNAKGKENKEKATQKQNKAAPENVNKSEFLCLHA